MRVTLINKKWNFTTSGFTLIEMCIVLIIMGFLLLPLTIVFNNYQEQKKQNATREAINNMAGAIAGFVATSGRFPCPSDRSLAPGDANYGLEQYAAIPNCTGAMQGVCRTAGARDTTIDADLLADPIIIGGVPIETLRPLGGDFGIDKISDGWGSQLTYAVSDRLCNPAKTSAQSDYKYGVITVLDEYGNPTAGVGMTDVSEPPDGIDDSNGMFIVISHGSSAAGAYNYQGAIVANCAAGTEDRENCDNDGTFVSALTNTYGDTANFYDDMTYVYLYQPNSLWDNMRDLAINPTPHIINLNTNNVGVLTDTPQERLHVNGNARASTVRSDRLCYEDGTACFETDFLGPARTANPKRNNCPAGQVITVLGNNTVACSRPAMVAPGAERRCGTPSYPGTYLRGILTNGEIICTN